MNTTTASLETLIAAAIACEPGEYSVAVKEFATGRRWLVNPCRLRAASLIKLWIMAEAFRRAGLDGFDLAERVTIPAEARVAGGSLELAPPGTAKTWRELTELMIVESDNTATNMLIGRLGMASVNTLARGLDCHDTVLARLMMDFAAAAAGRENYTTPADVATILEKLYRGECLGSAGKEMAAILLRQQDRCKLPLYLPPGAKVACKSGQLAGAEHDAGIVYGERSNYVIAVMADGLPDAARGQEVIARLSRTVYDYLHNNR